MAGFVQIIEFKTSRIDEVRQLVDEMRDQLGPGAAVRGTAAADRDRPGYYLNIVEFDSYESAMENSARPEISQFAARMDALCDERRFYNLDVVDTWEGESGGPSMKTVVAGAATAAAGVAAAAAVKSRSGSESGEQSEAELSAPNYTEAAAAPASETVTVTRVEEVGPPATTAADYPDTRDRSL